MLKFLSWTWLGLILGVSFLATPAKFQAETLTLPVALEVGRVTFRLLDRLEWLLLAAVMVAAWRHRPSLGQDRGAPVAAAAPACPPPPSSFISAPTSTYGTRLRAMTCTRLSLTKCRIAKIASCPPICITRKTTVDAPETNRGADASAYATSTASMLSSWHVSMSSTSSCC